MEAITKDPMKIRLNDVDREILAEIDENGRATVKLLADVTGKSRSYAGRRTRRLYEHELLEEAAPTLYDITERGRERLKNGG